MNDFKVGDVVYWLSEHRIRINKAIIKNIETHDFIVMHDDYLVNKSSCFITFEEAKQALLDRVNSLQEES